MKELVVISGKGGTGKTSVAASFAVLAENPVIADCDVDAADLHLVLSPVIEEALDFYGGKTASIIRDRCAGCGRCYEVCRFGAVIKREGEKPLYEIDHLACEGCGVCSWTCPEKAVEFKPDLNGQWYVSSTSYGPMVHARLGVAGENSGKLVSMVRKKAREIALEKGSPYIIVDGPPGIGCPVIASVAGADAVLIVAEPTISGRHDMERVARLADHFKTPALLCINKYDINREMSEEISKQAKDKGVRFVGRIRYDRTVTDAQVRGVPVVKLSHSKAAGDIRLIWDEVKKTISEVSVKNG